MRICLLLFIPCLVSGKRIFATTPQMPNQALQQRTNFDPDSCTQADTHHELIDALRRISSWADMAISAISPLNDGAYPERTRRNGEVFSRVFRREANVANRMEVYRTYQILRDETFRPLRDVAPVGEGLSRITLECEMWFDYDSPCDPFDLGNDDYARTTGRQNNHVLLCPPYFALNRHLPRNEIEETKVTVLMNVLLEFFSRYFMPHAWRTMYEEAFMITRFATVMYLRSRHDDPHGEWEEDRLLQADEELTDDPDDEPPDVTEGDRQMYGDEDDPGYDIFHPIK